MLLPNVEAEKVESVAYTLLFIDLWKAEEEKKSSKIVSRKLIPGPSKLTFSNE